MSWIEKELKRREAKPVATTKARAASGSDSQMPGETAAMQLLWEKIEALNQALPDTLRYHGPIGWAARDSSKPGRDAAQENWVIQADPEFSRAHLEATPEAVIASLLAALPAPEPLFAVAHRWRFSLLETALGQPCLWDAAQGLGYASDGCLAGRAESAWESVQALAQRVLAT